MLDWRRDIRLKDRINGQIYTDVMSYDFYSTGKVNEKRPEFTFEKRLWRDITNPFGDPLDADSMKRILFQLKRFLYLASNYLQESKSGIGLRVSTVRNKSNQDVYFKRMECPLIAPPLVDLAWRLFLTYTP